MTLFVSRDLENQCQTSVSLVGVTNEIGNITV
jgi:hypothetical protein